MDFEKYTNHFDEKELKLKLKSFANKIGLKLLIPVLTLYHCMIDHNTPMWAKSVIVGAIGYFILPIDMIPDIAPLLGFTDDIAMIAAATKTVTAHITDDHKNVAIEKATALLKQ